MADSRTVVKALMEVDPRFTALCKTLFGDAVDAEDVWTYLYSPDGVSKMNPTPADVSSGGRLVRRAKGVLKPLAVGTTGGVVANQLPQNQKDSRKLRKADDTTVAWEVTFSKVDDDKRQVFGWASVTMLEGRPVVDRQGDLIDSDEIEKAAYAYVQKSRKGGHQHRRDGEEPFHASDMIESIVFTNEKISKMGLPDHFPRGWWVGYQVHDEDTWQKVKKGEVTGFSIHGRGKRQEVPA